MKGSSGGESVKISFQVASRERDHPRTVGFLDQTPGDSPSVQKKNLKRDPYPSQSSSLSLSSAASPSSKHHRSAPLTKSTHHDLNASSPSLQNSLQQAWIPPGKTVTGREVGGGRTSREGIRDEGHERTFELTTLPIVYSDGTNQFSRSLLKKETERFHAQILSEGRPKTSSNPDYAAVFYFKHNDLYGKNQKHFTSTLGTMESTSQHGLKSKFSEALSRAGMYRKRGFDTSTDRHRVVDNAQDWMLKNI